MRLFLVLIALFLICESCSKKSSCDPNNSTYVFEANKELRDTTILYGLDSVHIFAENSGTNLVFKYTFGTNNCNIATDFYSVLLNFQINPSLTGFEYRDSSILTTHCYAFISGEAIYIRPQIISKGIIKGSKLSATKWNINVQVQPDFGGPISFNKTFTLAQ